MGADFQLENEEIDDGGDGMEKESTLLQAGKGTAGNVEVNRGNH